MKGRGEEEVEDVDDGGKCGEEERGEELGDEGAGVSGKES